MKTLRLDQHDSYLKSFSSKVVAKRPDNCFALAETAFYPSSGGQLFDTGYLNGIKVLDVIKEGDTVWHRLEHPIALHETVRAELDWSRRYRHMQRHSAQHLLSQAFLQLSPAFETRAVSLASALCTLDLAAEPSSAELGAAETLVNEVAYQNLAITAFEIDESELAAYPLRRPPKVTGRIRLVKMGDFELSACGGTHLKATAEALPIKILKHERIRGQLTRISFMAGLEALEDYHLKHQLITALAQSLSAQPAEVPRRLEALHGQLTDAKQAALSLQNHWAAEKAQQLIATAKPFAGGKLITYELAASESALLTPLADVLAQQPKLIALLGLALGHKASLVFVRSPEVSTDMREVLQLALPLIEGRGGGKAERVEGGGARLAGLHEALEQAEKYLLNL